MAGQGWGIPESVRIRTLRKIDIIQTAVHPFRAARQRSELSVKRAGRAPEQYEARRIYSYGRLPTRHSIPQSARAQSQFKEHVVPSILSKTEQLAFYSQKLQVEAYTKNRLKEQAAKLHALIRQEKKAIEHLQMRQTQHYCETAIKKDSHLRATQLQAKTKSDFQILCFSVQELQDQIEALARQKIQKLNATDCQRQKVQLLRSNINQLKAAIALQQRSKQQYKCELMKMAKSVASLANEQIVQSKRKADLLISLASLTADQSIFDA